MNILIIRFSALGDLVTLEPTFRAIKYFYPNANITFLTSNLGKALYGDTKYFDTFIVHKKFFSTVSEINTKRFDLIFNLHCNSLSHMLSLCSQKDKNINISASFMQKILGIKVKGKELEVLLENANIAKDSIEKYFTNPLAKKISLEYIQENEFNLPAKYIALSTGASQRWESKKWGLENYKNLISQLLQFNYTVVLIGTNLEVDDAKDIEESFPSVINLTNKTSLSQLKSILANALLYIGNDSGPTHIAAAVGTKTITIFGSTDKQHSPKFGRYLGEHAYTAPSKEIECHPCYKPICPKNMECMKSVAPQKVYEIVQGMING